MMRGAAAAAMRRKQPAQRKPTKCPTKSEESGKSGEDYVGEGSYNLDSSTSELIPFDLEAFRVKFSEVNSGNEECVYYKDDEDRFIQR